MVLGTTYSSTFGLGDEDIDQSNLDKIPDGKNNVCIPTNFLHGNRPSKLVQQASGIDSKVGKGHSLGTHLEREHFDRVKSL
jgi:hypothetical protein